MRFWLERVSVREGDLSGGLLAFAAKGSTLRHFKASFQEIGSQRSVSHGRLLLEARGVPEARVFRALQSCRRALVGAFGAGANEALSMVARTGLRGELKDVEWRLKALGVFAAEELQLSVQTGELLWSRSAWVRCLGRRSRGVGRWKLMELR